MLVPERVSRLRGIPCRDGVVCHLGNADERQSAAISTSSTVLLYSLNELEARSLHANGLYSVSWPVTNPLPRSGGAQLAAVSSGTPQLGVRRVTLRDKWRGIVRAMWRCRCL